MAEREGFEPSIEFPLYTLSKRAPSTTRPSLRFKLRGVLNQNTTRLCPVPITCCSPAAARSSQSLLLDDRPIPLAPLAPAAVQLPPVSVPRRPVGVRKLRRQLLIHLDAPARRFVHPQVAVLHHR